MGFTFACIAWFCFCITFFGSWIMLCLKQWTLFGIGMLISVGIIALTWIVACIYWAIDFRTSHAKRLAEYERTKSVFLKEQLDNEKWTEPLFMASMVIIYIALCGIFAPLWLVIDFFEWVTGSINNLFPKATA